MTDTDPLDKAMERLPDTRPVPQKIALATEALKRGEKVVQGAQRSSGRGRPAATYSVGGVVMNKAEYDVVQEAVRNVPAVRPMSQEEFETLAQMALPQLMHRAVLLAQESTSIKDVLAVAKEIGDRAFGKAKQTTEIVHTDRDIRKAWDEFEVYDASSVDMGDVE